MKKNNICYVILINLSHIYPHSSLHTPLTHPRHREHVQELIHGKWWRGEPKRRQKQFFQQQQHALRLLWWPEAGLQENNVESAAATDIDSSRSGWGWGVPARSGSPWRTSKETMRPGRFWARLMGLYCMHAHTCKYTRTCTYTLAQMQTHIHAHTHTHTRAY